MSLFLKSGGEWDDAIPSLIFCVLPRCRKMTRTLLSGHNLCTKVLGFSVAAVLQRSLLIENKVHPGYILFVTWSFSLSPVTSVVGASSQKCPAKLIKKDQIAGSLVELSRFMMVSSSVAENFCRLTEELSTFLVLPFLNLGMYSVWFVKLQWLWSNKEYVSSRMALYYSWVFDHDASFIPQA